MTDAQTYIQDT